MAFEQRGASAIAELSQMADELAAANAQVAQLQETLRAHDDDAHRRIAGLEARLATTEEDRARYRAESHLYRGKLIEIATAQAHLVKIAAEGAKIAATVESLLVGETKEEAEAEQAEARELVTSLDQMARSAPLPQADEIEAEMGRLFTKGRAVEETGREAN